MIDESIVTYRLLKNFYRSDYNKQVFGIQAQNIDAAALSMYLRNNTITYDRFISNKIDNLFFRTWGPRNTLHIYDLQYYDLLRVFNIQYGNWFEKKWNRKNPKSYSDNILLAVEICKKNSYITRQLLIENGVSKEFVDNWGGIFIDLCQKGYLLPCIENGKTVLKCLQCNPAKRIDNIWETICYKYFDFFGPATYKDFAHWLSIDCSQAMNIINNTASLISYEDDFYDVPNDEVKYKTIDEIIITSKFDNIFLAYANKSWIIDNALINQVWIKSGIVEAAIIYHNKIIGTWRYKKGKIIRSYIKLFYDLDNDVKKQILEKIENILVGFWNRSCIVQIVDNY